MKKRISDSDMPIGKLIRVKDVLPSPEELMASERTVKITLRLSADSIKFFKQFAQKYNTKYQKLIRNLIDAYTEKFNRTVTTDVLKRYTLLLITFILSTPGCTKIGRL